MASLIPFLWGSCIPYNMTVYPGALWLALDSGAIPLGSDDSPLRAVTFDSYRGTTTLI